MKEPAVRAGRPPGDRSDTRARVVQVATRLFAENGYHATGVAEIGRAAGLRSGALYYHIGSKEELLFDVLRGHLEEMRDNEEAIAASDAQPVEKLRNLIASHTRTIATRRDEVRIWVRDADALTGERALELQDMRERIQEAWRAVFVEGVRTGDFRTADHALVSGALGMVNNLYMWYQPRGQMGTEQLSAVFSDVLIDGIRAPRKAPGTASRARSARSTKTVERLG
jgi:AcrR family transcriptional regulator